MPLLNFPHIQTDKANIKIVGNLPFNVGTALMLKWLRLIPERKGPFAYGKCLSAYFTFRKIITFI